MGRSAETRATEGYADIGAGGACVGSALCARSERSEVKAAYEVLLRVELASRDFAAVGRMLDTLESCFPEDDQRERITEDPAFERFCFSPEYRRWLLRREERLRAPSN